MYKFKVIDKLPSPPSIDAIRGTHVHAILEKMFALPNKERTFEAAESMIRTVMDEVFASAQKSGELEIIQDVLKDQDKTEAYISEVHLRLENYFKLENPALLNPSGMEVWVTTELEKDLKIGGIVDRIEVSPTAGVRISDYKTGACPAPRFQESALFQMWFYALVYAINHNWEIPKSVKMLYLKDANTIVREPTKEILDRTMNEILEVIGNIRTSEQTDSWTPRTSKLCDWCNFQDRCPEFSGA
jgi:putative RecB family exonuclease